MSLVCAWLALLWSSGAAFVTLGALSGRRALGRRASATKQSQGDILLIRPCAGDEPDLRACLTSVLGLTGSRPTRVVLAVSEADDGAVPVIEAVLAELRAAGLDAELAVFAPRGPNRKVALLAGAAERYSNAAFIVCADSNADLGGFNLDSLLTPLASPSIGAAWAPNAEWSHVQSVGNRASVAVMNGSLHAFALLSGLDPKGLVGKLFAIRRDALNAVGGFGDLVDYLGEDFELARRLERAGLGVTPIPQVVRAWAGPRTLAQGVDRYARWMTVVRAQRPWLLLTYPLFFFYLPLLLPLGVAGLTSAPTVASVALGLAVVSRFAVAAAARHYARGAAPLSALVPDIVLSDVMLLLAFGRALSSRKVTWRGVALRIDGQGRLYRA